MTIKTVYSPLLENPKKHFGDGYFDLEGAKQRGRDRDEAEDALLGEYTSEKDYVPDGGWGWLVTLGGFVIWVRCI